MKKSARKKQPSKRQISPGKHINKKGAGPTPERLFQLVWGFAPTLIIDAAVRLRLFDCLDKSAQTVEQLSTKTQCSVRGLTALLNALVALEFLKRSGNRYSLAPESAAFLVSTKPAYHGNFFQHMTRQLMPNWMQLEENVRTGKPLRTVNAQTEGAEFFAQFVEGLFPMSYRAAQITGEHLKLRQLTSPATVLDIGAGSGVWGIALAQQSPQLQIHAVDWPQVLEVTSRIVGRHGLADRLHTSAGDLLETDFGSGHHVATIGHILHSEGPDRSRKLLKKVYDALTPGGTVVIAEFVPNDKRTGPPGALIFAVNMLIHTQEGDTFTYKEMSAWLREAGFQNIRQLEAPAPSPLLLATKPKAKKR